MHRQRISGMYSETRNMFKHFKWIRVDCHPIIEKFGSVWKRHRKMHPFVSRLFKVVRQEVILAAGLFSCQRVTCPITLSPSLPVQCPDYPPEPVVIHNFHPCTTNSSSLYCVDNSHTFCRVLMREMGIKISYIDRVNSLYGRRLNPRNMT